MEVKHTFMLFPCMWYKQFSWPQTIVSWQTSVSVATSCKMKITRKKFICGAHTWRRICLFYFAWFQFLFSRRGKQFILYGYNTWKLGLTDMIFLQQLTPGMFFHFLMTGHVRLLLSAELRLGNGQCKFSEMLRHDVKDKTKWNIWPFIGGGSPSKARCKVGKGCE